MEAFTVTIPQLAAAIPVDMVAAPLQLSAMPDVFAGLGALIVATIGVLVVRNLKDQEERTAQATPTPIPTPHPTGDGFRKAA